MSEDVRLRDPERLALDPELAPLLEQANAEAAKSLNEARAFQLLAERLALPVKRGRWQRLSLGLAAGALAMAGASLIAFERSGTVIVVGPEASVAPAGKGNIAREEAAPEQVESPRPALISELEPNRAPPRTTGERREKARGPKQTAAARFEAPHPAEPDPQEDCLALARQGQPQQAERCFAARAAGSGLSAEMALYEMARLRRDVLRDAAGALAVLGEYRQRFPRGSLRNEVDLSRVELLALLGRGAEALQESSALLDSATGRERAAELHLLRGNVYRHDLGDLRAAASEYAQVEAQGGARGAQASQLRAACLEALKERGTAP